MFHLYCAFQYPQPHLSLNRCFPDELSTPRSGTPNTISLPTIDPNMPRLKDAIQEIDQNAKEGKPIKPEQTENIKERATGLHRTKVRLERRVENLDHVIWHQNEKIAEKDHQVISAQEHLERYRQNCQVFVEQSQYDTSEVRVYYLQEIDRLIALLYHKDGLLHTKEMQLHYQSSQIIDCQIANGILEGRLACIENNNKKVKELESAKAQLENEKNALTQQVESLNESLKGKQKTASDELREARAKIKQAVDAKNALQAQFDSSDLKALQGTIATQEKTIAKQNSELAAEKNKNAQQAEQLKKLQEEFDAYCNRDVDDMLTKALAKIRQLDGHLTNATDELKEKKAQIAELKIVVEQNTNDSNKKIDKYLFNISGDKKLMKTVRPIIDAYEIKLRGLHAECRENVIATVRDSWKTILAQCTLIHNESFQSIKPLITWEPVEGSPEAFKLLHVFNISGPGIKLVHEEILSTAIDFGDGEGVILRNIVCNDGVWSVQKIKARAGPLNNVIKIS